MISTIILAGGKGLRFGSTIPKQFMSLNGKKVIDYSIDILSCYSDEIIVVAEEPYKDFKFAKAGKDRQESVLNGLMACNNPGHVIIHEAVRPFITHEMVQDVVRLLITGSECVDTATDIIDGLIVRGKPASKKGVKLSHTPEGFNYRKLLDAHLRYKGENIQDDVSLYYKAYSVKPVLVEGEYINQKITFMKDIENAEGMMKFYVKPLPDVEEYVGNVLIFGGSSGIGQALSKMVLNKAPKHKEVDVSKEYDIDLKDFDAIVYSAGEYKNDEQIMKVNFDGFVRLIKLAEQQNWKGNIVALSSTAAIYGRSMIPIYSASKAALNSYIEARHEELADKDIFVNAIAPAKVDTPLQKFINPKSKAEEMMTPEYIAKKILPYLNTCVHGHIIYHRKGFDK